MFKIGQKVVCITKFKGVYKPTQIATNKPMPKLDNIYIIKDEDEVCVKLIEFGFARRFVKSKFAPLNDWKRADVLVKELVKDLDLQLN